MADPLVREWLADSKALSPTEAHSFACTIAQNLELIHGIFSVLEERSKNTELLESVCNQLFTFYRCREGVLQRFALQYLPALIGVYLCSLAQNDKKSVKSVEVLLLGIYNLEVADASGKAKVHSFRLPCIAQPSIYHAPVSLASAALTENALSRLEKGDNHVIAIGPFQHVESLNAQNRMKVMTVLMNVYNRNLSSMSKPSLLALCRMCSRLTRQGFGKPGNYHRASSYGCESLIGNPYPRPPSRVPLTHSLILEVLHGVYYSMFNGLGAVGLQALDDAHARATYDLAPEVLLVTNAIRNSLRTNPSGQPSDGPMGISISLSPSTSMTTVSKSIITNASFRTKKLPDDTNGREDSTLSVDAALLGGMADEQMSVVPPVETGSIRSSATDDAAAVGVPNEGKGGCCCLKSDDIPIQTGKDGEVADVQKVLATISEEADDGDKKEANTKVKDKEKAVTPLIGMISKISEKTKLGRRMDDQQSSGNKGGKVPSGGGATGNVIGFVGGSAAALDGTKNGCEAQTGSKSNRKDSESSVKGGVQNGDAAAALAAKDLGRVDVAVTKNQLRSQVVVDTIEMVPVGGTKKGRLPSSNSSQGAFDNRSDDAGSMSSYHSSSEEEEKSSFLSSSQKMDSDNVSTSHSEFHTLV